MRNFLVHLFIVLKIKVLDTYRVPVPAALGRTKLTIRYQKIYLHKKLHFSPYTDHCDGKMVEIEIAHWAKTSV
jgi:hypothetical protein